MTVLAVYTPSLGTLTRYVKFPAQKLVRTHHGEIYAELIHPLALVVEAFRRDDGHDFRINPEPLTPHGYPKNWFA